MEDIDIIVTFFKGIMNIVKDCDMVILIAEMEDLKKVDYERYVNVVKNMKRLNEERSRQ